MVGDASEKRPCGYNVIKRARHSHSTRILACEAIYVRRRNCDSHSLSPPEMKIRSESCLQAAHRVAVNGNQLPFFEVGWRDSPQSPKRLGRLSVHQIPEYFPSAKRTENANQHCGARPEQRGQVAGYVGNILAAVQSAEI